MKKVTYDRYGGVDVLTLSDVAMPTVEKDSVLIKVKAVSINPVDWKIREGELKIMTGFSFPKGVGLDFAGVVEEVGEAVQTFKKGDEVFGISDVFAGRALAEYVVVKPETISHKPTSISFNEAAALPIVGSSALQIFDKLAPLKPGMNVLIFGATGGIGTNAIQLAKRQGAHVTAVVRSKGAELAKQLGSDVVIDYDQQDVLKSDTRFDVVLDLSGKMPYSKVEDLLKPDSVYVTTIPDPTEIVSAFVHDIFSKKKREVLNLKPSRAYLDQLAALAADGLIIPIGQTYPIDAVQQAYAEAAKGGVLGKAIITL